MAGARPGRGSDQFPLRLPDGMRDRIKERAEANGRSMNAEIVSLLEGALAPAETIGEALSGKYNIPADTPDEAIDRAIHNAIAKALRSLSVRRDPEKGDE